MFLKCLVFLIITYAMVLFHSDCNLYTCHLMRYFYLYVITLNAALPKMLNVFLFAVSAIYLILLIS